MTNAPPRLLVLDDDAEIAQMIGDIAAAEGYRVDLSTDFDRFAEQLSQGDPEMIVLDLQMPGTDGIQVLRHLGQRGVSSQVLIVSAMDARTLAAAEKLAAGNGLAVTGTLQKPFAPQELVGQLLRARSATEPPGPGDIERAIGNGELVLHFQPVVTQFADGSWDMLDAEALLRWRHPERGMMTPETFLPIAEQAGLASALADFVLLRGIEQLRAWSTAGLNVGLRVNMSAALIADLEFPDRLSLLLRQHDILPSELTLEISESAHLDNRPEAVDILTRLRVAEVNLALDDFGVGQSSLTQLFDVPFTEIKLDGALIRRTESSAEARKVVQALVDLAHNLGMKVCAEQVENRTVFDFIAATQCDAAQGHYISPPVPGRQLPSVSANWLAAR